MRATNDKLIEKYIVVIARELGKALKGLHAAGILHRDIKGRFSSTCQCLGLRIMGGLTYTSALSRECIDS